MGIENEAERSAKPATDAAHLDRRICERAYLLWESEGRQDGKADEYHRRARELIDDGGKSAYSPGQSQGDRD
jgi:hypothetical protein